MRTTPFDKDYRDNNAYEGADELGSPIGKSPTALGISEFKQLGHTKTPLLRIIRENCLDCQGDSSKLVRECAVYKCRFWPYRMGSNPFYNSKVSDTSE